VHRAALIRTRTSRVRIFGGSMRTPRTSGGGVDKGTEVDDVVPVVIGRVLRRKVR
jgi:hypothetical protein